MKIGFDAKWFFNGPPSGRRVVRQLVESLGDLLDGDELHLFLDAQSRDERLSANVPAARRHYVWAGNNQLSNLFVVPRAANKLGLDAVVYQNFVPPPSAARHARIAFVYDAIFDSHPRLFSRKERLYFKPMRYLSSTADRVCTGSRNERERLARYRYARSERIDVVPNGVGDLFTCRENISMRERERVRGALKLPEQFILFVGRLNVRKNVPTLVRALQHVATPGLALVVAGAPDETCADLAAITRDAGVSERVHLLGGVSEQDLRVLYATATVFCFPSLDEGFGMCPLEAMASGTPVVVSNIDALVETCGDAALYVDPMNAREIAATIDALIADPVQYAALREAGLRRAAEFTWRRSAECLLASIRTAAGRCA